MLCLTAQIETGAKTLVGEETEPRLSPTNTKSLCAMKSLLPPLEGNKKCVISCLHFVEELSDFGQRCCLNLTHLLFSKMMFLCVFLSH